MKRLYDLSLPLSSALPIWPGDPPLELEALSDTSAGADYTVSVLRTGVHTGTHVDAPRHIDSAGMAVDALPLSMMIGDAWVARFPPSERAVTRELLEASAIPTSTSRLLLATGNSDLWSDPAAPFRHDYVYLTPDAADWVLSRRISLVGIDYLSIGPPGRDGLAVHRTLLSAGVVIVEGLNLSELPSGGCELVCLPLRLAGADGAPARAIAIR